jgi:hypothetical protein
MGVVLRVNFELKHDHLRTVKKSLWVVKLAFDLINLSLIA